MSGEPSDREKAYRGLSAMTNAGLVTLCLRKLPGLAGSVQESRTKEQNIIAILEHYGARGDFGPLLRALSEFEETQGKAKAPSTDHGSPPPHGSTPVHGIGPGGSRYASVILVVGQADEFAGKKKNVDYYGEGAGDWRPYLPKDDGLATWILQGALHHHHLVALFPELSHDIVQKIRAAEDRNMPVVIAVDPWTVVQLQDYREIVREYDEGSFWNSAMVVLWNDDDDETHGASQELEDGLHATFIHRYLEKDTERHHFRVCSPDDLRKTLGIAITAIQSMIARRGKVCRPLPEGSNTPKPEISAWKEDRYD